MVRVCLVHVVFEEVVGSVVGGNDVATNVALEDGGVALYMSLFAIGLIL